MMNLSELKHLVSQGESEELEFKASTASLKAAFKTICAFLNGSGGTVLFGVKDDGTLIGQTINDHTSIEIASYITKLEPPVPINTEYVQLEGNRYIIVLTTPLFVQSSPHVFQGCPYWRIGSVTQQMPQGRYQQLLLGQLNQATPWDSMPCPHLQLEHLDEEEILACLSQCIERGRLEARFATKDPKQALHTLGLLSQGQLTNATGVLFCREPEHYFPTTLLVLASFQGIDKRHLIESRRLYTHAFSARQEAESFLLRHMVIKSHFHADSFQREDRPEYPLRAVREAIINAICHRDYTFSGGSIHIMLYKDRLEITSHGRLPPGLSLNDLTQPHTSIPRNPKITQVFYRRGLIEAIGSGTLEMMQQCQEAGLPLPVYLEDELTFQVTFHKEQALLSARQNDILAIVQSLAICTTNQILQQMKDPPTDRTLRNDLAQLESMGMIRKQGTGRSTSWCKVDEPTQPSIPSNDSWTGMNLRKIVDFLEKVN